MRTLASLSPANDKMTISMAVNVLVLIQQGMIEQINDVEESDKRQAYSMIDALGVVIDFIDNMEMGAKND